MNKNDIDFPLSGGNEPDMKFNKTTLLLIAAGILSFLIYLILR